MAKASTWNNPGAVQTADNNFTKPAMVGSSKYSSVPIAGQVYINVDWNIDMQNFLTATNPMTGFRAGLAAAVNLAVSQAPSPGASGTGALAADLKEPWDTGPMSADIGSDLPYAAIQHFGGTIEAESFPFARVGGDWGYPGLAGVTIPGTHYMDGVDDAFVTAGIAAMHY